MFYVDTLFQDKQLIGGEVSSDMTLLDYIRHTMELRGTKYMCREGGCGACIVTALKDSNSEPMAVNSCLVPVLACHGWEITTIEKVGNRLDGYHKIQKTLAEHYGTQCGYCSPGWVMAMYSLTKSKKSLTMLETEKAFGSNICRCTGYRPILEAFKTFAKDAPQAIADIEDLYICEKGQKKCLKILDLDEDWCVLTKDDIQNNDLTTVELADGKIWFKVQTIQHILEILKKYNDKTYMLLSGNTAKGIYTIDEYPDIIIDISAVSELKCKSIDQNLIIGAGTTITELVEVCAAMANEEGFEYLQKFNNHFEVVAHIPVRNIASIGGNLMMKHENNDFASDIFLLFETVGAQLTVLDIEGHHQTVTLPEFLKIEMAKKIILHVLLPPLSDKHKLVTYKVTPRAQNVAAYVNAGFLFELDECESVKKCRIVYGGLSESFIRAETTEKYLNGKSLFSNDTLQSAIKILEGELVVVDSPPKPSVTYRKQLAISLFYKCMLTLCPTNIINKRYQSGSKNLRQTRPVSQAKQSYDTDESLWPLTKPIQKVEGLMQCSGEALYTDDIPSFPREVFATFVLSTVASGDIVSIDPAKALKVSGVTAFYTASDIPGRNVFYAGDATIDLTLSGEELLCSGKVKYYNQPLGIIVAESQTIADKAAKMVVVKYKNTKTPVTDIKKAKTDTNRVTLYQSVAAETKGTEVTKVISGNMTNYWQYHFTLETVASVCLPKDDDGLEVYVTSQMIDGVQEVMTRVLNLDSNSIDVYARRLGGGLGIKISRPTLVAAASGLVTRKLNRPCRCIMPLTTVTNVFGKRLPFTADFEVGVNDAGVIQYVNENIYEDYGYMGTERGLSSFTAALYSNCYNITNWNFNSYIVTTDTPKNTWCRAPGTLTSVAIAETIIERISYELSLDPLQVRLSNLSASYSDIKDMIETLKTDADYSKRRSTVDNFNANNRWKKRGLRFSSLKWGQHSTNIFDVNLSVCHGDGSIYITHGGVEMGQGVNTKAVQICAYLLNVSVNKIKIKENNTVNAPNSSPTGGNVVSLNIPLGVQRCCEELKSRLKPIKSQMTNPTWEELIKKAYQSNVDLQIHGFVSTEDEQDFYINGVVLAEVEVDILTGESEIVRVDILQDVGRSVNPETDIGQIEGAFIMGTGYWTCEKIVFNQNTGQLLTNRSWSYQVPQARDIPQDFRIYLKKKSYSNDKYLGSKCVGEPPICLAIVVPLALREAIVSARTECNKSSKDWFDIDGAFSLENICLASATKTEDFKLY